MAPRKPPRRPSRPAYLKTYTRGEALALCFSCEGGPSHTSAVGRFAVVESPPPFFSSFLVFLYQGHFFTIQ